MSYEFLRVDWPAEHVLRVLLHRPERLNALHGPLLEELSEAVEAFAADAEARVLLLGGAPRSDGRPCFGGGVDLRAFAEGQGVTEEQGVVLTNRLDDLAKPSIAVIDGVCTTGAAELALACDFRLVGEASRVSDWHLKNLGTGLGSWGSSTRWARLVGVMHAKELILTGKELDAAEAVRIGFASASHASVALWDAAIAMAQRIAEMDPAGVALALSHLQRVPDVDRDEALRLAARLPDWMDVSVDIDGKDSAVLGRARKDA